MKEGGIIPEWKQSWDQLRAYRDAVFSGLKAHGMNEELVVKFGDLFVENAGRRWEEDPDAARQYMQHTLLVITSGGKHESGDTSEQLRQSD